MQHDEGWRSSRQVMVEQVRIESLDVKRIHRPSL